MVRAMIKSSLHVLHICLPFFTHLGMKGLKHAQILGHEGMLIQLRMFLKGSLLSILFASIHRQLHRLSVSPNVSSTAATTRRRFSDKPRTLSFLSRGAYGGPPPARGEIYPVCSFHQHVILAGKW